MASADPAHVIVCPNCSARFAVRLSMVGRRARCAACDAAFTVPAPSAAQRAGPVVPAKVSESKSEPPAHIAVECRVCGTLMYGRPDQIGKRLKCPDCGAFSVVPPPPKPKPKSMPAALEGEQYELWDADTQPLPSEILAAQPNYIAVKCRKCATLMHATEKQVGQPIVCPDCGAKHIVPPPPKPAAKRSVLTSDADTPVPDTALDPGERPAPIVHPSKMFHEEQQESEYARALEKSKRTGKRMEIDSRGRPVLPRFPLLTGILPFPFTSGCPSRWAVLTLGLVCWAALLADGIPAWVTWSGGTEGAMRAMAGLGETVLGAVFAIIWIAAASSVFIAIVSQSAVGTKRISDWPTMNFIGSMAEMLPVGIAVLFTGAPGWMLGQLIAPDPWQLALLAGGSLLFGFPITLLSQLAGDSTWELIDLNVLGAAIRCPFSMMLFYLQSACLAAICALPTIAIWQVNMYWVLALAPLYVACLIVYARLLGRLAWRLSEKMPADEQAKDSAKPTDSPLQRSARPNLEPVAKPPSPTGRRF